MVHGGPGTRKSFLAKCINEVALEYRFTIGCIAPTAIAASNLPNGKTAHNFCGIPITHHKDTYLEKPSPTKLSMLQNQVQHNTLALLLIDEISNLGPVMFGLIENRIRPIMENDEMYGGLAVIAMGDFSQLPPVRPADTLFCNIEMASRKNLYESKQSRFWSKM
jgi:PIF1-like helicase